MRKVILIILPIFIIISLGISGYAFFHLADSQKEYSEATDEYRLIADHYLYPTVEDKYADVMQDINNTNNEDGEFLDEKETDNGVLFESPISVDFSSLADINNDIVGWIYAEKAGINLPITQSTVEDPDRYLHYTFEGKQNGSGCPFIYPDVDKTFNDPVTFIFGHNMANGSMFGSIAKAYGSGNFIDEYIYIYKRDGIINKYQIFATVTTRYNSQIFSVPGNSDSIREYITRLNSVADYIDTTVSLTDRNIIALSTCKGRAGTDTRFIVFAVLDQSTMP